MARRAAANMGEYLPATETYLRLALKAQSQCRATLETLAAIKNPPIIFAEQANVTTGPQQINNGATVAPRAPAAKNSNQPIQLSGIDDELSTNARASSPAIPDDTSMEAVATVHWAEDAPEGKAKSAMRGFKGDERAMLRELARLLKSQAKLLKENC